MSGSKSIPPSLEVSDAEPSFGSRVRQAFLRNLPHFFDAGVRPAREPLEPVPERTKSRRRSLEHSLRRHTFHLARDAHPHSRAHSKAIQRVALEIAEPVSPTSMQAVERQLERMRARTLNRSTRPAYRASDPGVDLSLSLERLKVSRDQSLSLTTFSVCEESPRITSPCTEASSPISLQDAWASLSCSPTKKADEDGKCGLAHSACSLACSNDRVNTSPSQRLWRSISEKTRPHWGSHGNLSGSFDSKAHPQQSQLTLSSSPDKDRVLQRSASSPFHRLVDNSCGSSPRVQRESYVRSESFRNRRLTDSDCVANLQPVLTPEELAGKQEEGFGAIARELGLLLPPSIARTESHVVSPGSSLGSPSSRDSSKSPRNLHPAVKLRKLRSNNSYFCDEARPIMPLGPVPASDRYWTARGRHLRSLHSMVGRVSDGSRAQSHSPTSVLSRRSSRNDHTHSEDNDGPRASWQTARHRMSETGVSWSESGSLTDPGRYHQRRASALDGTYWPSDLEIVQSQGEEELSALDAASET